MANPPPPPEDPPPDEWPTRVDQPPARAVDETVVAPAGPPPPTGPPPDEADRRIGMGLLLGLLLLAVVAAALVAAWLLTRDNGKKQTTTVLVTTAATTTGSSLVSVPRVIGLKEQEALVRLGQAGLRPKEQYKPTSKAKGVVVSQAPQEATDVKKGAQVTIVIDSGAPKVAVPNVVGQPVDQAVSKLDAQGLDSRQTTVTSTKPAGTVVDQAPPANQKAAKGSLVTLSVAKAAAKPVPNVVGQPQSNAQTALQNAGFKVTTSTVPSSQPKGTVTAQSPAAGQKATAGSSVRINVSDGTGGATTTTAPPPATTTSRTTTTTTTRTTTTRPTTTTTQPTSATVPDLSGQQLQSAVQQLGTAGLLASVQYIPGTDPLETVLQQSPAAGQTVKARSHVTLNVSSGPGQKTQKTVPNAVGQTLQQAVSTMQGAGLRLIYAKLPVTDRTQAGKIVEQTPAAGKTAPQNAQVLVYLGAFQR